MEYSLNEVAQKRQAILWMLDKGTETKYKTKLIYALRKNLGIIEDEIELVKEQMKDSIPEFSEFQEKKFELAEKHGGEVEMQGQQRFITNADEVVENPKYKKAVEKLEEEYKEAIDKQDKVVEHNQKIAEDAVIDIDWYNISIDWFNEEHFSDEMPQALIDIIAD